MDNGFKELGLNDDILKSIEKLGYTSPSKIQTGIIPLILEGNDCLGQAQTGTGKTLAYAASILSLMNNSSTVQALILTPTRELALQVSEEFDGLDKYSTSKVLAVYGGTPIDTQIRALKRGVNIVVGTPGRVMDLIKRRLLKLDNLRFFVLDEADEMLDMGFEEDIKSIFEGTKEEKQVLLFSATMPSKIKAISKKYMRPNFKIVSIEEKSKTSINVTQNYCIVDAKSKNEALFRILDYKEPKLSIIFCNTKKDVDDLLSEMTLRKYSAEAMHGDVTQAMRIKTLDRFKKGSFTYLIATDVAARGIHVENIDLIINYRLPQDVESYIHRIGRTGRASSTGEAISLISSRDIRAIKLIEDTASCTINKMSIPTKEDILAVKKGDIDKNIQEYIQEGNNLEYLESIKELNKEQLLSLCSTLLKKVATKNLGSDFGINVSSPNIKEERNNRSRKSNSRNGFTRVFITAGSIDKINRGSLIHFLKDYSKIREEDIADIEIMQKFTFASINEKVVDKVIATTYNKKLDKRVIRIEKANK